MPREDFYFPIDRPPSEVFAFSTDNEKRPIWQSGVEQMTTEGPPGPGVKGRLVRQFLGRRVDVGIEYTEFEPGKRYAYKTTSGPLRFEISVELFESEGGGTLMHVTTEGRPQGFFRLLEPIVMRAVRRQIEADVKLLAELVEAEATQAQQA